MKNLRARTILGSALAAALLVGASAHAATSYRVPAHSATEVNEYGTCYNVSNSSSKDLFVPTKTSTEWSFFYGATVPNASLGSCAYGGCTDSSAENYDSGASWNDGSCSYPCDANQGHSCTSGQNSCGQSSSGTIQCDGSCSASTPSNPAGLGNSCQSSSNSCGQTNTGTIQCDGSCSASAPANPAGFGSACYSYNSCNMSTQGIYLCDGSCSAQAPSESFCPRQPYCTSYWQCSDYRYTCADGSTAATCGQCYATQWVTVCM